MAQQSNNNAKPSTLTELMQTLQLVWRLVNDPRVPVLPKLIIPAVVLYVLSPIDLIPDFIVGLGQLDDAAVIFFGVRYFIQLCPPDVVMEHRRAIAGGGPNSDYVDATYRVVNPDEPRRK